MADGTILPISYAGGDGNDVDFTVVFTPSQNDEFIHDVTLRDGTGAEAGQKVALGQRRGEMIEGNPGPARWRAEYYKSDLPLASTLLIPSLSSERGL